MSEFPKIVEIEQIGQNGIIVPAVTKTNKALLAIHGYGSDRDFFGFQQLAESLPNCGVAVSSLSLPAHTKPKQHHAISIEQANITVEHHIRALVGCGYTDIGIYANSFGSIPAINATANGFAQSLILDSGIYFPAEFVSQFDTYFANSKVDEIVIANEPKELRIGRQLYEEAKLYDTIPQLKAIDVPTLFLQKESDPICTPDITKRASNFVRNSEIFSHKAGTHYESDPKAFSPYLQATMTFMANKTFLGK